MVITPGFAVPTGDAVILAGGQSRRFGSDKACAQVAGRPLLAHVAAAVAAAGFCVHVSAGAAETYAAFGYPVIVDRTPRHGPLAALHTILSHLPNERCLIVTCDMPDITPALCRLLWHRAPSADLTLLANAACHLQPFPGVYARALLPQIAAALARNQRDMHAILCAARRPAIIPWEIWCTCDPAAPATLRNVNRPSDLIDGCA